MDRELFTMDSISDRIQTVRFIIIIYFYKLGDINRKRRRGDGIKAAFITLEIMIAKNNFKLVAIIEQNFKSTWILGSLKNSHRSIHCIPPKKVL